jgi:uncharacterized radical SAM superfamily protein
LITSMGRAVDCFYPGLSFPSISTTGTECALDCKHCSRRYLQGMVPATSPDELLALAEGLAGRGAEGFLLSGGADPRGKVRLAGFEDAIRQIKSDTGLKINAHIGLASDTEIRTLIAAGVDAFSVDLYGSKETISEVLGLPFGPEDYFRVFESLVDEGAPIVAPHVCVGIDGGRLKGEFAALERLGKSSPDRLVLISLVPTKGTAYERVRPPAASDLLAVVNKARAEMPDTKLLLGCMRSRLDRSWEAEAVRRGVQGVVLPSVATVETLRSEGYRIRMRAHCCALM